MARKSTYNPKYHVPWVKSLARCGLTVDEIAKEIGVAKSTLCRWAKDDPELSDALNEGRSFADSKVEDSLYSLALGKTVTETKKRMRTDKNGEMYVSHVDVFTKEIPPNPSACIFWLKNRKPGQWRDKPNDVAEEDRPIINITIPPKVVEDDS